jgi:hypothetical protein
VPIEDEQGMVHASPVVAMVVGAFLLAVGGVLRRVEVQEHPPGCALLAPSCDVDLANLPGDAQAVFRTWGVLQA